MAAIVDLGTSNPPVRMDDSRFDGCTGSATSGRGIFDTMAAWRDDGQMLWLAHRRPTGVGAIDRWDRGVSSGAWSSAVQSDVSASIHAIDVTPDWGALITSEFSGGICRRTARSSIFVTTVGDVVNGSAVSCPDFVAPAVIRAADETGMIGRPSDDLARAREWSRRKRGQFVRVPFTGRVQ
jgi:hypothetical protein